MWHQHGRIIIGSATLGAVLAAGCARPPQPTADSTRTERAARLDSATVARLCAAPDSVRAGTAECALYDQSRPPRAQPLQP